MSCHTAPMTMVIGIIMTIETMTKTVMAIVATGMEIVNRPDA